MAAPFLDSSHGWWPPWSFGNSQAHDVCPTVNSPVALNPRRQVSALSGRGRFSTFRITLPKCVRDRDGRGTTSRASIAQFNRATYVNIVKAAASRQLPSVVLAQLRPFKVVSTIKRWATADRWSRLIINTGRLTD